MTTIHCCVLKIPILGVLHDYHYNEHSSHKGNLSGIIPMRSSSLTLRFRADTRDAAFLACVTFMSSASRSARVRSCRSVMIPSRIRSRSTCIAPAHWGTVRSFFPRFVLGRPLEKEAVVDRSKDEVPIQSSIEPDFSVVQTKLHLAVLKTSLDTPARKSNAKKLFNLHRPRSITQEELDLTGPNIPCHKKLLFTGRSLLGLLDEAHRATLPDLRPLFRFVSTVHLLSTCIQATIRFQQLVQALGFPRSLSNPTEYAARHLHGIVPQT